MQQVRTILEIRYKELPSIFAYKKQILHKLIGDAADKQLKDKQTFTENIKLEIEKQKATVHVQANRTVITIEQAGHNASHKFIQEVYKKVWDMLKISKVDQIGYRCGFIEPSELAFDDLVAQYKRSFLQENSLIADAMDVGLPLTFKVDGYRINFMTGPMTDEELKRSQLEFPADLPKTFSFVDLDFIKYQHDGTPKAVAAFCSDVHKRQQEYLTLWKGAINE